MIQRAWLASAGLTLALGMSACGEAEPTPETLPTLSPQTFAPHQSPTPLIAIANPTQSANASAPAPSDTDLIAQGAASTLASFLNVPNTSIALVGMTEQQWPDTSLGCPQLGQVYAQVITPGYLITFKVDEATYEVHADLNQHYVVCQSASGALATPTPPDPVVAEFIMQIRESLSADLGVPIEQVVLVSSEAVDWPDGALGCEPRQGTEYAPEVVSGYRIIVAVDDDYYEYHTSFDNWILCAEPTS